MYVELGEQETDAAYAAQAIAHRIRCDIVGDVARSPLSRLDADVRKRGRATLRGKAVRHTGMGGLAHEVPAKGGPKFVVAELTCWGASRAWPDRPMPPRDQFRRQRQGQNKELRNWSKRAQTWPHLQLCSKLAHVCRAKPRFG